MRILLTIFLLPLFVSVQSLATVCVAECSFEKFSPEQVKEQIHENMPSCHQEKSKDQQPKSGKEKDGCASKICELDGFLKSEISQVNAKAILSIDVLVTPVVFSDPSNSLLGGPYYANGPPGLGFYFNRPLYIQKSSFLI